MKKIFLLMCMTLIAACTYYPLGMSEVEWNALSQEQKLQARMKDAELREQRQLRYAIERQNRLKEDRIEANTVVIQSTANAATAAANAANTLSNNQQNTLTNNITVSPVITNTNNNDVSTVNTQGNTSVDTVKKTDKQAKKKSWKEKFKERKEKKDSCKQYTHFMEKGDAFKKDGKLDQAEQAYKMAAKHSCESKKKK